MLGSVDNCDQAKLKRKHTTDGIKVMGTTFYSLKELCRYFSDRHLFLMNKQQTIERLSVMQEDIRTNSIFSFSEFQGALKQLGQPHQIRSSVPAIERGKEGRKTGTPHSQMEILAKCCQQDTRQSISSWLGLKHTHLIHQFKCGLMGNLTCVRAEHSTYLTALRSRASFSAVSGVIGFCLFLANFSTVEGSSRRSI